MKRLLVPACAIVLSAAGSTATAQTAAPVRLPYAAVHDPQFISAADAAFMTANDRVIGLTTGKTAKAYPASILSQHGLVEDQSPNRPLAVTW